MMDLGDVPVESRYFNLSKYKRVFRLADTPDTDDFLTVAGVAGGGILLMGLVGYAIFMLVSLLPG